VAVHQQSARRVAPELRGGDHRVLLPFANLHLHARTRQQRITRDKPRFLRHLRPAGQEADDHEGPTFLHQPGEAFALQISDGDKTSGSHGAADGLEWSAGV
jgi:hypothetical protein